MRFRKAFSNFWKCELVHENKKAVQKREMHELLNTMCISITWSEKDTSEVMSQ